MRSSLKMRFQNFPLQRTSSANDPIFSSSNASSGVLRAYQPIWNLMKRSFNKQRKLDEFICYDMSIAKRAKYEPEGVLDAVFGNVQVTRECPEQFLNKDIGAKFYEIRCQVTPSKIRLPEKWMTSGDRSIENG